MWRLITAYRLSRAIALCVELGIPELLARHPHTAAQLAADTKSHEASLRRLLRLLVAMEVLAEDADGRFRLTALGEEMRAERLGPLVRLLGGTLHWDTWRHLDHSIKTGGRGFDFVHGMRDWDYYAQHPIDAAVFDAAMHALTTPVAKAVARAYEFSRHHKVADVGGGDGTMLIAILEHHAGVRGLLFDRPGVVERARKRFTDAGLLDRVEVAAGSFFEKVPAGAGVYLMKSIIHDWTDEEASEILTRCREAAATSGAPLLLVERIMSDHVGPEDLDTVLSDLNMMVNPGGRERTRSEYAALFERAGYRLEQTIAVGPEFHILEALPV